jgi:hypothetical protein
LHAAHERPETIIRVLKRLAEKKSCKIMAIYLNKKKVYTGIEESKHTLYNMVTNILLDRIMTKRLVSRDERIYFIASRRETKKALNENFKAYLMTNVQARHAIDMDISIKAPDQEKCLQLADIVSWAIARKYELRDERYYEIIKDLIIEESPLIP